MLTETIALPPLWLPLVSMLIPVIVAASTKATGSSSTRQARALALVVLVAVLQQVAAGAFTVDGLVVAALTALITQLGVYLGVNRIVDLNNTILPSKGIGA